MKQQDVKQYIIVPPASRLGEFSQCRHRFADWLAKRYPRLTFEVAMMAPIQDDDHFIAIPIMNFISPDGDSFMCKEPDRWLVNEIVATCAEFEPGNLAQFAA